MMKADNNVIYTRQNRAFYCALLFTAAVFPFSEALVSIAAGLLLLQVIIFRSWSHPSVKYRSFNDLIMITSIFGIYLVGALFTLDSVFALYELKKVIFWVIIPLAFYLSPELHEKQKQTVLMTFVFAVSLASLAITVMLNFPEYFKVGNVRSASFISHIRFSFQVILALIILGWFIFSGLRFKIKKSIWFRLTIFVWLCCFLVLLQSLLGLIVFLGTFLFFLVMLIRINQRPLLRVILLSIFMLILLIPSAYIGKVILDYYGVRETTGNTLEQFTSSGNRYLHDLENTSRENGYLVYIYLCEDELRREWNKRSEFKYDDELNQYPLSITLLRYMTSLGYRKDSVGVSRLSDSDIEQIQKGVTNYRFHNRFLSIYPRIYETVWEMDNYIGSGDPNYKSLAQRIEFHKASLILIAKNPLFGIGTGNWVLKYNEVYDEMNSKLDKNKRGPSHNQYLNYMVKFGIAGFLWIFTAILLPFFRNKHQHNFVFVLFLVSIALGNFGDANLETHMGLTFFSFFYCFFLLNAPATMKQTISEEKGLSDRP